MNWSSDRYFVSRMESFDSEVIHGQFSIRRRWSVA
jgi:hypothetical protein